MQVVLGGELSPTIFALEGHSTLVKWNTILKLKDFWQQIFPWKHLQKLVQMLSCYQAIVLLYMTWTICILKDRICVILLYLKFWLGLRVLHYCFLHSRKEELRYRIMKKKKKTELEWILNQHIFTKVVSKFQF